MLEDQTQQKQETAVPEELVGILTDLLRTCELEDQQIHNALVVKVKRLICYFNNIVTLFWDRTDNNWRTPNWDELEDNGMSPRIINRYRPHAESIIAALSVAVPVLEFFPEDADNPDDIDTAEAYTNLAVIIQKYNKSPLLFIKALTILFNQGTVFGYSYYKRDKKFGFYSVDEHYLTDQLVYNHYCPNCGQDFGQGQPGPIEGTCPNCQAQGQTSINQETVQVPATRPINKEKGRGFIDLFGVENVKVPYSARKPEDAGFLILKFDKSVAFLRSIYCQPGPDNTEPLVEKIEPRTSDSSQDSWTRYPSIFLDSQPMNTAVVKLVWYRTWQFRIITDKDEVIQQIQTSYPDGCYVTYINDIPVEIVKENLDEHWTFSFDPRAEAIHGEPLGTNLATIQDVRAEIDELELQTMEHSISEVFIASDALNWTEYKNQPARPGNITPVIKQDGRSISENFYETRTATLSPEVNLLKNSYDNDAEFVTGDTPTISGQPTGVSGETATAFTKSQAQAIQRLGIVWKIVSDFWVNIIEKTTKEAASYLEYEEKYVSKLGGSFQNIKVSPDSMHGNVGQVICETSDQLPISWSQIKDVIVSLLQLKDESVDAVVRHPQNNELMKKAIGIPGFFIPGEDERVDQYREINEMLKAAPIPGINQQTGMQELQCSLPLNLFDTDLIHMETCKDWLVSSKGYKMKTDNPPGYLNIELHWQAHQKRYTLMQMSQVDNSSKEKESNQNA